MKKRTRVGLGIIFSIFVVLDVYALVDDFKVSVTKGLMELLVYGLIAGAIVLVWNDRPS